MSKTFIENSFNDVSVLTWGFPKLWKVSRPRRNKGEKFVTPLDLLSLSFTIFFFLSNGRKEVREEMASSPVRERKAIVLYVTEYSAGKTSVGSFQNVSLFTGKLWLPVAQIKPNQDQKTEEGFGLSQSLKVNTRKHWSLKWLSTKNPFTNNSSLFHLFFGPVKRSSGRSPADSPKSVRTIDAELEPGKEVHFLSYKSVW